MTTTGPDSATDGPADQPGSPAARSWVVEVSVDPEWYAAQDSPDPRPESGRPLVVPLLGPAVLVGRTSTSRGISPDVDCGSDSSVSRRQCRLTFEAGRWSVADLGSANGTFVGPAGGPLPEDPVPAGAGQELVPGDRVYVGAWTRLVVRPARAGEHPGPS